MSFCSFLLESFVDYHRLNNVKFHVNGNISIWRPNSGVRICSQWQLQMDEIRHEEAYSLYRGERWHGNIFQRNCVANIKLICSAMKKISSSCTSSSDYNVLHKMGRETYSFPYLIIVLLYWHPLQRSKRNNKLFRLYLFYTQRYLIIDSSIPSRTLVKLLYKNTLMHNISQLDNNLKNRYENYNCLCNILWYTG